MEFFKILDNLKKEYENDKIIRKNGTLLLGPGKIPNSKHYLFKPLTDQIIDEFLVSQFKWKFPEEYIKFLKYTNGANLCNTRFNSVIKKKKYSFAHSLLCILGLPMTPPFSRDQDMEEPFDMRIEDLARHEDIPEYWLKCGTYTRLDDIYKTYDIFIDTKTELVYSCERNDNKIIDQWETLDKCFCSIYKSVSNAEPEYDYEYRPESK